MNNYVIERRLGILVAKIRTKGLELATSSIPTTDAGRGGIKREKLERELYGWQEELRHIEKRIIGPKANALAMEGQRASRMSGDERRRALQSVHSREENLKRVGRQMAVVLTEFDVTFTRFIQLNDVDWALGIAKLIKYLGTEKSECTEVVKEIQANQATSAASITAKILDHPSDLVLVTTVSLVVIARWLVALQNKLTKGSVHLI